MSENTVNQNHNNQNINYNSSAEKALMLELLMSNICNAVKIGCLLIETDEKNGTNLFDTAMESVKNRVENLFEPQ